MVCDTFDVTPGNTSILFTFLLLPFFLFASSSFELHKWSTSLETYQRNKARLALERDKRRRKQHLLHFSATSAVLPSSTAMPFPRFADGDVEVRFTKNDGVDQTYVLHSHVLKLHSPWFEASLSDRWNKSQTDAGSRHLYELRSDKDRGNGTLVPIATAAEGLEMIYANEEAEPEDENLHLLRVESQDGPKAMFAALYHVAPAL